MDLSLEFFTNDRYEILNILFNKQVQIKEDFYIPLPCFSDILCINGAY